MATATSMESHSSAANVDKQVTLPSASSETVSILRRFILSCLWTPFGLVLFYLVMVGLSSISKGLSLERLAQNGWPRAASRHTGAVTAPVFALFLVIPPSSLWSLFMAVMVCCAHFAHFVIISSDLRVFGDPVVVRKMFRLEPTHPVFRVLPLWTAHVVGTIGLLAMVVVSLERCYGPGLGKRERRLPFISRLSCTWIWAVFNLWFGDRLLWAALHGRGQNEIIYPLLFLGILFFGAAVAVRRERNWDNNILAQGKKTN